jgi:hypothetical protein
MSWMARRRHRQMRCPEQPGVADVSDDHEVPLLDDGHRGAAALDRVQAAATPELVVYSGACGHAGLLLEVELAVAKLLLVVDERRQRECLLLVVFVWGFQVRYMDSFWRWFMKMAHKLDHAKKITENKCHA